MSDFSLDELASAERLRLLHFSGWRFLRKHAPEPPHELEELVYSFLHGEWLDVLVVQSSSEAKAGRFLTDSVISGRPQASWAVNGPLANVLDSLCELPPPSSHLAPRLIVPPRT